MSDANTNRLSARAALLGLVLALSVSDRRGAHAGRRHHRPPTAIRLGKPPNENERILRIGIDVQANELVTTAARTAPIWCSSTAARSRSGPTRG